MTTGPLPQQSLATVSLLVRDYDEAIEFFTGALQFKLVQDLPLGPDKRWVLVSPEGGAGADLLLARASNEAQAAAVGHYAADRVGLFLHTSDFDASYQHMREQGVRFTETPRDEAYGRVAVFLDLYGNKWDLVEPKRA
jgi:catechol 2,3-dioxygenase-like lactoylglutathione lyase family enzyme